MAEEAEEQEEEEAMEDSDEMQAEIEDYDNDDDEELEEGNNQNPGPIVTGMVNDETQEVMMGLSSKSEEVLSAALMRMRKILQSDMGGKMLHGYVLASPKCVELLNAWNAGPKARTAVSLLLLLADIFRHPMGLRGMGGDDDKSMVLAVQLKLDKFASSIVQSKLADVYSHLSSGQRTRENSALRLMSSIVSRGKLLAKQVASKFDFSLDALKKLGKHSLKNREAPGKGDVSKLPTRVAFVDFAMSFLVAGDTGLLRWILQKRVLYVGLLHGLANDADETLICVLGVFKQKVLLSGSVPQGIQVALFGDAALEQLVKITARESTSQEAAELAQEVLLILCTDPAHGICPSGSSLEDIRKASGQYGGGAGRLLRLMLKLKAAEVNLHKELLLAICTVRPLLAAAYIDTFPYSLEPRVSSIWFSAMSLVSSLVRIANCSNSFRLQSVPPSTDSPLVQSSLRRIWPQTLARAVYNKALLHDDQFIKLSCLRLLLEVLAALHGLLQSIQVAREASDVQYKDEWQKLECFVQDKARLVLPDCHTLLSVYFSSKTGSEGVGSKRKGVGDDQTDGNKKLKFSEDGAVYIPADTEEIRRKLIHIWEEDLLSTSDENLESITSSKLVDVFTEYQKVLPLALRDINFDPLKFIPEDLKGLTISQQQSLVRMLLSTMGISATMRKRSWDSGPLYKNLKLFMKLVVSLNTVDVRQQACLLLDEALHSTGAFESNPYEAAIWLHNLPGWQNGYLEFFDETVAAFFCDVVLNAGKNLYKYVDQLHSLLSTNSLRWTGHGGAGDSEFGPLLVCILDTYKRLARPDAKSLKIPQRAAISVYISKALQCLLSSQVYPQKLAGVITSMLSDSEMDACEWYPLRNLNSHASTMLNPASTLQLDFKEDGSLNALLEACQQDELGSRDVKSAALAKALVCVAPTELTESFFNLLEVQDKVLAGDHSVTVTLLGAYPQLLYEVGLKFPAVFSEGKVLNRTQQKQNVHKLSTLLASFLRSCPFSVLFLAASYGAGRLLTLLRITDSLSEVMSQVSRSDIIISARLVLQKIGTLYASRSRDVDMKAQIEACFNILKDFILSPRSSPERQQLVEDFLRHPVVTEYFLSETRARGGSPAIGVGECEGDISARVESLDPLNRYLLQILAGLLPDTGNSAGDCCEPLIQRATEAFDKDVKQSFASDKEVVYSASLLTISILSPYAKMDFLIDFVQTFSKQAVERSKSNISAQTMRSYQLVVIHLALLCFQKLQSDSSKSSNYEDKLMDIYSSVIHFTMVAPSDMSDSCMLTAMQILKVAAPGYTAITPIEVLFHYMQDVNSVKREVVLHLIQESPFMLVEFGRYIGGSEKARLSSLMLSDTSYQVRKEAIRVEELMQLLPAVQYFLARGGGMEWCQRKTLTEVSSLYGDLLVKQLLEWEAKADSWAGDMKQDVEGKECYQQSFLCSIVTVLQLSTGFHPLSTQQKRQLLRFLLPKNTKVLDTSVEKVEAAAFPKMNNRIVGKASLLKWLILEQAEVESPELIKFITASISTITAIYKQGAREDQRALKGTDLCLVERTLLVFICDSLDELLVMEPSCTYSLVRKMAKTLLRFRFAQPEAMGALHRIILKLLQIVKPEDTLTVQKLAADVMDFVMAHSQFVQILLTKEAAASATKGIVFRGIPSLLSVIGSPSDWQNQEKCSEQTEKEIQRLGLLKLLRVLYTLKVRNKDHDVSMGDNKMTSKEFLSLLLAAYGATLSAVDQEIFSLMNEVECGECLKGMSEMDYLWGDAALARRKETAELKRSSDEELFQESLEEIRKRRFKEDLALDPRKCAITVLHFPMKRDLSTSSSAEYENGRTVDVQQAGAEKYDPAFILPFAMHALSTGCMDPEDFVRSGLLAICFSTMSSACESLRKCGYELLSIFTSLLEGSPSFKCKSQIDSLLLFVRNAVTEPWQRLPFVVSLFSAEASCILMHPENALYVTVNRFLLRFPSIDLKSIPLFQSLFTSGSQESRIERSWIFKLLLAGLSTSADALIYRREFVPEIMMSFSTSSMTDRLALRWVLQVFRRGVVFPTFAKSLVKDTGVLSWLSSVIVNCAEAIQEWEDARLAIEVVDTLLSMRVVEAFLVTEGTEELSRTAIMLLQLLCTASTTSKQWEHFSKPYFRILKTALRLAQKKKKFQSSTFRLGWRPVRELVHQLNNGKVANLNAIECLLHSPPPPLTQIQDGECLCTLTTLILSGRGSSQFELTSTAFLRWCSASLILTEQSLARELEFTTWWSFFTYLNSKTRDYYFSVDLPRCLIALSNMNAIEAATDVGAVAAVNALLVLLTRTSRGSSLVSGAVHELLKILLSELPCPQELDPHWRWGFYKARSQRNLNLYQHEIYKLLLALLQRLYAAPWGSTSDLIRKWKSALQIPTSDDISEDAEASSRLDELRKRLYVALQ